MAIYFLEGLVSTYNDAIEPFARLARKLARILHRLLRPARSGSLKQTTEPFR